MWGISEGAGPSIINSKSLLSTLKSVWEGERPLPGLDSLMYPSTHLSFRPSAVQGSGVQWSQMKSLSQAGQWGKQRGGGGQQDYTEQTEGGGKAGGEEADI